MCPSQFLALLFKWGYHAHEAPPQQSRYDGEVVEAHYCYEDFLRSENSNLQSLNPSFYIPLFHTSCVLSASQYIIYIISYHIIPCLLSADQNSQSHHAQSRAQNTCDRRIMSMSGSGSKVFSDATGHQLPEIDVILTKMPKMDQREGKCELEAYHRMYCKMRYLQYVVTSTHWTARFTSQD